MHRMAHPPSAWSPCTLLLLLAVTSGCESTGPGGATLLEQGEQAYQAKQYDQAVAALSRYLNNERNADLQARALYVRALCHGQQMRRSSCLADLNQAQRLSNDDDLRWRIQGLRGTIEYEDNNYNAAIAALEAAVNAMPARPPMDAYLFRLGECYERVGRWSDARAAFGRLLERFPSSSSAASARKRVDVQAGSYAVQCGVFGSANNAQRLANDLRGKGLDAAVRPDPRGGGRYLVLVGNYARFEEARAALARVKGYVPEAILWP